MPAATRTTGFVPTDPARVYAAFLDPAELTAWLPPGEMAGSIKAFEARVGGGYVMSLAYPQNEAGRGKTTAHEDRVRVRFLELSPPHRIVEAVTFDTEDPDLKGEMTLTVSLVAAPGGSLVELAFDNLPPGLRPEDNQLGARISLNQLAARFADQPQSRP